MDVEPPPITAPPPRVSAWRTVTLLALAAFVTGVVAMAIVLHHRPAWLAPAGTPATAVGPAVTSAPPLAGGGAAAAVPSAALDVLASRESELAARLAELEARTATVSSDARAASGNAGRAEALLISFAARRALDRGQPLGYVEEQLRARFGANQPQAVAMVLQAARDPVTLEDLRAGLDGVAPLLVTGAASDGWTASLRRELGNLVTIHHATAPSALPADRMTRARRLLEAGQVEAALAEVARLPGAPSAAAWTGAARRYVGARQALDRLEAVAIQGGAAPR